MTDIEEIVSNGAAITESGDVGNDTIQMFGDFSLTSLRPSTITIVGGSGNDTVDISSLLSAHRIVFKTGGGHDVIIGAIRPQDVLQLPSGMTIADFAVTINETTGQVELVGDEHSISFTATGGLPQFTSGDDWMPDEDDDDTPPVWDDDEDDDTPPVDTGNDDDDDDDDYDDCDDDDDNHGTPGDNDNGSPQIGRASGRDRGGKYG